MLFRSAIEIQYVLLSLPGVAVALLPLVPGYSWTIRYLELWPLATLLLVPTTLGAWLCGLPGARRFLLGCLLPPAGVVVALLGLKGIFVLSDPTLATMPLGGVALGGPIIAGTGAPREYLEAGQQKRAGAAAQAPTPGEGGGQDPQLSISTGGETLSSHRGEQGVGW